MRSNLRRRSLRGYVSDTDSKAPSGVENHADSTSNHAGSEKNNVNTERGAIANETNGSNGGADAHKAATNGNNNVEERTKSDLEERKKRQEALESEILLKAEQRRAIEAKERLAELELQTKEQAKFAAESELKREHEQRLRVEAELRLKEEQRRIAEAHVEREEEHVERLREENTAATLAVQHLAERRRNLLANLVGIMIGLLGLAGSVLAYAELRERNFIDAERSKNRERFHPDRQRQRIEEVLDAPLQCFDLLTARTQASLGDTLERLRAEVYSDAVPLLYVEGAYGSGKSDTIRRIVHNRSAVAYIDLAQTLNLSGTALMRSFLTELGFELPTKETGHAGDLVGTAELDGLEAVRNVLRQRRREGKELPVLVFDNLNQLAALVEAGDRETLRFMEWCCESLSSGLASIIFVGDSHSRLLLDQKVSAFAAHRRILFIPQLDRASSRDYVRSLAADSGKELPEEDVERVVHTLGGRVVDLRAFVDLRQSMANASTDYLLQRMVCDRVQAVDAVLADLEQANDFGAYVRLWNLMEVFVSEYERLNLSERPTIEKHRLLADVHSGGSSAELHSLVERELLVCARSETKDFSDVFTTNGLRTLAAFRWLMKDASAQARREEIRQRYLLECDQAIAEHRGAINLAAEARAIQQQYAESVAKHKQWLSQARESKIKV